MLSGCAAQQATTRPVLAGSFKGQTSEGKTVQLTFREEADAFRGEGAIGDDPILLSGVSGWRGTGSLVRGDGRQALVKLELSADGERVLLETDGSAPLELVRGGAAPSATEGPLSGRYIAKRDGATLAEATLMQRGALLGGIAVVAGDSAGISGHVSDARHARGFITFIDGSQIPFTLEVSADGQTLQVDALGQRVALERRGAP